MCTYILGAPNYHPCCVECWRNSTKALAAQVFGAGDLVVGSVKMIFSGGM